MIWLEQEPETPELQHYRLQTSGQTCQCPLNLGAEQKARKSSGQLQAPRNPLQEPACAEKGTRGASSHISSVENGAGAASRRLHILSSLLFPHLFWLHLAQGTQVMPPARPGPLELTAGATNAAQHSQLGTWGTRNRPTHAGCHPLPGSARQHDRGISEGSVEQSCIYSMGKESISHSYLQPGESWAVG